MLLLTASSGLSNGMETQLCHNDILLFFLFVTATCSFSFWLLTVSTTNEVQCLHDGSLLGQLTSIIERQEVGELAISTNHRKLTGLNTDPLALTGKLQEAKCYFSHWYNSTREQTPNSYSKLIPHTRTRQLTATHRTLQLYRGQVTNTLCATDM